MRPTLLLCLLGTIALFQTCSAKVTKGTDLLVQHSQWHYLDRFCFDSSGGELIVEVEEPENLPPGQEILLYHDLDHGFPAIYDTGNSCGFKRALSQPRNGSYIDSTPTKSKSGNGNTRKFKVTGIIPRWWYVVLANCQNTVANHTAGTEVLSLKSYTITFVNDGGKFKRHFGTDEEGIFEALIFAILVLLAYGGIFGCSFFKASKEESNVRQVHGLMLSVIGSELLSVILQLAHRSAYSADGIGYPSLEDFTMFVDLFPDVLMTALLVFISKGWVISSNRIEEGSLRGVVEILVIYLASSIALFFWNFRTSDPALVLSIYQTPPGTILCILRVVLLFWFLSNLSFTWRNERINNKKSFYAGFVFYGAFHFLILPICVIMASALSSWNKKKAVVITDLLLTLVSYLVMWVLFGLKRNYLKQAEGHRMSQEHFASSGGMHESIDTRSIDIEGADDIQFSSGKPTNRSSVEEDEDSYSGEETS